MTRGGRRPAEDDLTDMIATPSPTARSQVIPTPPERGAETMAAVRCSECGAVLDLGTPFCPEDGGSPVVERPS